MAIYQFYLAAVPRKEILKHFGEMTPLLEVNSSKRTDELESI